MVSWSFILGNAMLPDSTKPLYQPMLNNHHWESVAFTWGEVSWEILMKLITEMHWKWRFWNYWSNDMDWSGAAFTLVQIQSHIKWFHGLSKVKMHTVSHVERPGAWINIKMPSYQYRKSHCGDKTILRPSYLHNGISYTGKMTSLYWIRAQASEVAAVR